MCTVDAAVAGAVRFIIMISRFIQFQDELSSNHWRKWANGRVLCCIYDTCTCHTEYNENKQMIELCNCFGLDTLIFLHLV